MITYDDIRKANDTVDTTDIKGRAYVEVNQRIKAFRIVYPTGTISTEILSNEDGVCVMRATVGFTDNEDFIILGTGTAYEKEGSTFINKTSYIENCETSAIGRALGMAGFGIDTSVASAEEVQNAIANQEKPDLKWIKTIEAECERTGISKKSIFEQSGIRSEKELDYKVFNKIMRTFERTPDKESK